MQNNMQNIMIAIRREHTENIHRGIKKYELRLTFPTKLLHRIIEEVAITYPEPIQCYMYEPKIGGGRGAVVGYFTLDRVDKVSSWQSDYGVTAAFMDEYARGKQLYAWRITYNAFYATPRPLSDFGLTRPPQSWCYIKAA